MGGGGFFERGGGQFEDLRYMVLKHFTKLITSPDEASQLKQHLF